VIVRHTVQATSSIPDSNSPLEGSKIYPNPFHAHLYVSPETTDANYELLDAVGRVVYVGITITIVDFSGLPNGVYYLKIMDEKTRKVTVQKFTKI
jgi:hypothetical protein